MTVQKEKTVVREENLGDEQVIALMGTYLSEWEHRDELMWSQVLKLFYATLIVIVLPNIAQYIGIDLQTIPCILFPVVGIVMAIAFLYIGLAYAVRLTASSRTYENMMKLLGDKQYERVSILDKNEFPLGYLFKGPIAYVLVVTMFFALVVVAVVFCTVQANSGNPSELDFVNSAVIEVWM